MTHSEKFKTVYHIYLQDNIDLFSYMYDCFGLHFILIVHFRLTKSNFVITYQVAIIRVIVKRIFNLLTLLMVSQHIF